MRPAFRAVIPSAASPETDLPHLFWILPLLLLIFFLASPRFRGDIAEARVRRLLAAGLEKNKYTVFNDLLLPIGGGTRQIDHVVVSKFGIFVIESRYVRGWISGTEVQERWKSRSLLGAARFDNPLHINRLQVETLQQLLDFPAAVFHPVVVLAGQKGFKTPPPHNVVAPQGLLALLRKETRQTLSAEQADRAIQRIGQARLQADGGWRLRPLTVLRLLLLVALIAGCYLAFRDDISGWIAALQRQAEQSSAPEQFHPDGSRKSAQELWEDSLVCAYSADTARCACYDRAGKPAELAPGACRALAEKGSVLKQ